MATQPRKSAARKPASVSRINSDTPAGVKLNLDTYEHEAERPEPFAVVVGGKRIILNDPFYLDWQDAADVDDPFELAEKCMSEEDREHFLETRLPMWKLQKLVEAYQEHYGLGSRGNVSA